MSNPPFDPQRFWADNEVALRDPFASSLPRPAMGIFMSYETIFNELGHTFDMRRLEKDYDFARNAARAYNDLAEKIVGRRLLDEQAYDPVRRGPAMPSIPDFFGCVTSQDQWSEWVHEVATTPQELSQLLDRMERLDVRAAVRTEAFERECQAFTQRTGKRPQYGRHLRGPVTLATSIYGTENLIYLILDEPELAARFRDTLQRVILEYFRLRDEISGVEYGSDGKPTQGCFYFADDNCALLTPEMYAFFGQPILQAVYDQFAPRPGETRYQHSDSDMGHLLPLLAATGMNSVNFGPTVRFAQIRAAMPKAVVHGTLAPFTFMNNDEAGIVAEVQRDMAEARETRGLVEATAGSVNNGSRLTSLRLVMETMWAGSAEV